MKKKDKIDEVDEILPEYDFSGGVRGKYADRVRRGTNLVLLDPDVVQLYPDTETINKVLRTVADVAKLAIIKK
ncbi:MAG: hypothetical protein HQ568_10095 [Calditrichaeota bacterium]|nr:hypothetical protein [Calditrichota bacterium]